MRVSLCQGPHCESIAKQTFNKRNNNQKAESNKNLEKQSKSDYYSQKERKKERKEADLQSEILTFLT